MLTLYGHIRTAEQRTIVHQYGDWYNGRGMGGLLHLVQRGGTWTDWDRAQSPSDYTKCNSPPINGHGQCTNFISFDVAIRPL